MRIMAMLLTAAMSLAFALEGKSETENLKVTLRVEKMTAQSAAGFLEHTSEGNIEIKINDKILADKEVTFDAKGVALHVVLDDMCNQINAKWKMDKAGTITIEKKK